MVHVVPVVIVIMVTVVVVVVVVVVVIVAIVNYIIIMFDIVLLIGRRAQTDRQTWHGHRHDRYKLRNKLLHALLH